MSTGSKPRIVNIVATGQFPKPLDIEHLCTALDVEQREYEPETYPALLVKVGPKRKHMTLYRNGKYIIAGCRSEEELMETYNEIFKRLQDAGALD